MINPAAAAVIVAIRGSCATDRRRSGRRQQSTILDRATEGKGGGIARQPHSNMLFFATISLHL